MLSYLDHLYGTLDPDMWKSYNKYRKDDGLELPWMQEPAAGEEYNWIDMEICKLSESDANNFLVCLDDADSESNRYDQKFLNNCFDTYMPNW